ncbi:hypothetical protein [Streptomyces sp. NPDC101150]|uniref:hypothetical protein n=1 Tax=Streptomyces sp. NPDC101150 TaxID=3366114 RepID=UPI00382C8DF5
MHAITLMEHVENRLNDPVDRAPLVALRAAGMLERTGRKIGVGAAFSAESDEVPDGEAATALGLPVASAPSRLLGYRLTH